MGRDRVHVHAHVAADPADVWAIARDFGGAWHPWIAAIRTERDARGHLVRAFTVTGAATLYREQLTYFSDSDRVLAYTHLDGISGVESYDARLTVSAAEAGGSVVTWTATIAAPAARLMQICDGTRAVFQAGIEALRGAGGVQGTPPRQPRSRPLR